MQVKDLNGKSLDWRIKSKPKSSPSAGHILAREIIQELWPTVPIFEECSIKLNSTTLYFDFVIPILNLIVEVDGVQHKTFSAFFHKSKEKFYKQLKNDRLKNDFCDINNIRIIRLTYPCNKDEWTNQIADI